MSNKPLFRWTIGPGIANSVHILKESLVKTIDALGYDNFDWMVCYNGRPRESLEFVAALFPKVQLYAQSWSDCPIPDAHQSILSKGKILTECDKVGGSLWKLCPPRLAPDRHEIIMDNDIVILKMFDELKLFLELSDNTLLLKERMKFLGRYEKYFRPYECYNSGLIGLPPYYDFGGKLYLAWKNFGSFRNLTYGDEQGLVTLVLNNSNPIKIPEHTVVELHQQGYRTMVGSVEVHDKYMFDNEFAIHFVESNRNKHIPWLDYRAKERV